MSINTERPTLNHLRYHYFLDPSGTNRKRFQEVMNHLTTSLLDWYLPGAESKDESVESAKFREILDNSTKTEEELEEIFRKRKKVMVPKAVPEQISVTEAIERYGIKNNEQFPERGRSLQEVIINIDQNTNPSVRFNQHFMGEMHPHDNIPAFVANYVSSFLNGNTIAQCVSPSLTYIEQLVTQWLADLVGYDHNSGGVLTRGLTEEDIRKLELTPSGNITSGGTIANLTALTVARNKLYRGQPGEKIKNSELVIFCSENAHYSMQKLAGIINLEPQNIIKIPVDENQRMNPEFLADEIKKAKYQHKKIVAVVATAGTTGCGAIDPIDKIADITEKEGIYLHVDAAHGGGFLTSRQMREKFKGIERADSVTIDGHKMFYTYYPCGGIVFKDKSDPVNFLKQNANYILGKGEHYDLGKSTIEGSRGTNGALQLYASILALGREGYETITDHTVKMTKYLAGLIDQSNVLQRTYDPEMNLLCFRYVPQSLDLVKDLERINELNKELNQKIYSDGNFYLGEDKIIISGEECNVQRAIIMHPYVETYNLDALIEKVECIGNKIFAEMKEVR